MPFHIACTLHGCIKLLDRSSINIQGKCAIIIGRSNLDGVPLTMLLMHRDIKSIASEGNIAIEVAGKANFTKVDWL